MTEPTAWTLLPAPEPGLRCVVVIPARNEAKLLPGALAALADQLPGQSATSREVLVLANNCTDDTVGVARRFAASRPHCPVHVVEVTWPAERANIGEARGELMDAASRRLALAGSRTGIIASTDADTRVAPDWLAATVAALDAGADAVGGRICTAHGTSSDVLRVQRLDDLYRLLRTKLESRIDPDPGDPWPRHHQHFGASLAVRASAYRLVGGLPRVPYLEDEALFKSLRRDDFVVRHSASVRVRTSGRLEGRAPVGLAWQLRQWTHALEGRRSPMVADPGWELREWTWRRRLRELWSARAALGRQSLHAHLQGLALNADRATVELAVATSFGRLFEAVAGCRLMPPGAPRAVPLQAAIRTLRRLVHEAEASIGPAKGGLLGAPMRHGRPVH